MANLTVIGFGENATGWSQLFDGQIVAAPFVMYDTAFAGWTIVLLFIVYQAMLIMKTRNITLSWVTGVIFVSIYASLTAVSAIPIGNKSSLLVLFAILVFEFAGILYYAIWK